MIDLEIVVAFNGCDYVWTCDSQIASAANCWTWSDQRYTKPATAIINELNKRFIDEHATRIAGDLAEDQSGRFYEILRSMGAIASDFKAPSLGRVLAVADPDKARRLCFSNLPAAAHTAYNCSFLRDWVFKNGAHRANIPQVVALIGTGPFTQDDLHRFLATRHIFALTALALTTFEKVNGAQGVSDAMYEQVCKNIRNIRRCGHVVVGREQWCEDEIDEVIDLHRGNALRIYSQEMFMTVLHTGLDPFLGGPDVLEAFRAGHPALEFVSEGWQGWVDAVVAYDRTYNSPMASGLFLQSESPLKALGYRAGKSGLPGARRQSLLRKAFEEPLPNVGSADYMQQWGEPGSAERLHKIANLLAANAKNQKQKRVPSKEAIADWEHDLAWLKHSYYNGHMRFSWPSTFV